MTQILLTAFVVLFAPIPWAVIIIHLLVKSGRWNLISKILVGGICFLTWGILAYWLFNSNFLFAGKFDSEISRYFGIMTLLFAAAIEFLSRKALGAKRIFGSSELEQSKDKLITNGIYAYARHPRYVEHPLWALGLALVFGYFSFLWFFVYLLIGFSLVAYFEEQELIKRYGKEYLEYRKKVPAFFIL